MYKFVVHSNKIQYRKSWRLGLDHVNGLLINSIISFYLLLDCLSVGFLYIQVQKHFFILTHNPKKYVGNMYILV